MDLLRNLPLFLLFLRYGSVEEETTTSTSTIDLETLLSVLLLRASLVNGDGVGERRQLDIHRCPARDSPHRVAERWEANSPLPLVPSLPSAFGAASLDLLFSVNRFQFLVTELTFSFLNELAIHLPPSLIDRRNCSSFIVECTR